METCCSNVTVICRRGSSADGLSFRLPSQSWRRRGDSVSSIIHLSQRHATCCYAGRGETEDSYHTKGPRFVHFFRSHHSFTFGNKVWYRSFKILKVNFWGSMSTFEKVTDLLEFSYFSGGNGRRMSRQMQIACREVRTHSLPFGWPKDMKPSK